MTWHPSAETLKRVYEELSAAHAATPEPAQEELVELARTLAKGGPYAATVERFARDHGYGRRDPEPLGPVQAHYGPDPEPGNQTYLWPDPDARPGY